MVIETDPANLLKHKSGEAAPSICPRVFILTDIRLLREGLLLALSQHASVQVIGSSDLSTPPKDVAAARPDVVLVDITMPGSLDLSRPIRASLPDVKFVAIAVAEIEAEIITCAEAGITGFVTRNGSAQDVVAAVHAAVRGEVACSARTAALLLGRVAALSQRADTGGTHALTRRESEIVSLLGEGLSNKEIARVLKIRDATVKNHVHNILGKMRLRRRSEVAARVRKLARVPDAATVDAVSAAAQDRVRA